MSAPEDLANLLHRNPNISQQEITAILTHLQTFRDKIDEEANIELDIHDNEIRIRYADATVGPSSSSGTRKTETRSRKNSGSSSPGPSTTFRKRIPATVKSYPLIHVENPPNAFAFPYTDQRFAASCQFPGDKGISVADHARLKPTDKISIIVWLKLPASAVGDGIIYIVTKEKYLIQIDDHATTPNQIRARVVVSGTNRDLLYTYTPNTWFHLAITWKSPNFKLYINSVLNTSRSDAVGTLDTSTKALGIGTANDGNYRDDAYNSGYL